MNNKKTKNNTTSKSAIAGPGRPKGSHNKKTEWLFELCEKHDFDPIETLIYYANGDWKALKYEKEMIIKAGFQGAMTEEFVISPDSRRQAAQFLVSYMYPKRKAIEHSIDEGSKNNGFAFQYIPPKKDEK